ncbi:hypothetical protein [Hymenobacter crusticola]|uniref:Uncharacterized protein n=1 Tax=Hymenobacter crusticola TaxID=1770526 RepID=A0A2C9ZTR2_9BACT|nr:hypothetical protein [Hymenobacter crusticola]OUJ68034.1 hypothetical protein BXP70_28200 [Hymenobacter crusticola]
MNYIALINHFWTKDLEYSFTPNETAVYFRLLERCNALGWKNPFNFSVDELLVKLRLKTKDPFTTARNRLKQAGLIDFRNGDGRGRTTIYQLVDPEAEVVAQEQRGKKNTPLSPTLLPPLSPTLLPPEDPLLHKTKLNQTKENLNTHCEAALAAASASEEEVFDLAEEEVAADQPVVEQKEPEPALVDQPDEQEPIGVVPLPSPLPGKKGKVTPAANPLVPLAERWPELVAQLSEEDRATWERFVEWEQENPVPKLFQMNEPLLPEQFVKLKRKHGGALVADIMLGMQNSATLLKKYDSARGTIEGWIRSRKNREAAVTA